MAMRKRDEEVVFANAAGIDIGGSSHWVAVSRPACDEPVREFGAMTGDLNAMADWLPATGDWRLATGVRGGHGGAGFNRGVLDTGV